jgi:hypothetical protein
VSFVRQSNTRSGTVDILAILNWTRDQGWISGTTNLNSFQFGFEITSAPGGLNFTTNSYSMSCGGRGGGTQNPTPTRTATQGGGSASCSVNYNRAEDWGAGFNGSVTIRNNGSSAINGWTLTWTFPGNQRIGNMWNGTYTQTGQSVSARNMSYNNIIGANGGTQNFGFGASYTGTNATPPSFTLNGTLCNSF